LKLKSRLLAWLVAASVAVPVGVLLGHRLDLKIVDQQFSLLRAANGPVATDDDLVLVGISEQTYLDYEWPLGLWHPYFGQYLSAMAKAGVRGLVLDVVMPQKPLPPALVELADRGHYEYHDDRLLAALIELSKSEIPVVIAEAPNESGTRVIRGYSELLSVLASAGSLDRYFGMAQVDRDQDDVHRRYRAAISARPTLAAHIATQLGVRADDGMINYLIGDVIDYIPMQTVTGWLQTGNIDRLKSHFADKVVVLGAVTTTQDRKPLPVRLLDPQLDQSGLHQPGVIVHFQALRSYLNGGLIGPVNKAIPVLLSLIALLCWWLSSRVAVQIFSLVIAGSVLTGLSTISLMNGSYLSVGSPLIILFLTLIGRILYESLLAFRDRKQLTASFSGYVSPLVLSSILSGDISASRDGEIRRVCVLFSDIRRFTSRSADQRPDVIISLLNRYFERMVECVHRHGGTVDKFMGDGLMAFFGAPNLLQSPAKEAMQAAVSMLDCLTSLNDELAHDNIEPLQIGIGLHVGEVVVGHVGSLGRHEYTAIGDTVNAAARLEGLTQETGYPIVLSENVYDELGDRVRCDDLGLQVLKGRGSMRVYGFSGGHRAGEST